MATIGVPKTSIGINPIAHSDTFDIITSGYYSFIVHRIYLHWGCFSTVDPKVTCINTKNSTSLE